MCTLQQTASPLRNNGEQDFCKRMSALLPRCRLFTLVTLKSNLAHESQRKMLCSSRFANKNTYVCRDLTLPHLPLRSTGFCHPDVRVKGLPVAGGPHPGAWRDVQWAEVQCQRARSQSPAPQGTPTPGQAGGGCRALRRMWAALPRLPLTGDALPEETYEDPQPATGWRQVLEGQACVSVGDPILVLFLELLPPSVCFPMALHASPESQPRPT